MKQRIAIYARTSTDDQTTGLEAQLMACREYCKRESIVDIIEFTDNGVSGKEDSRPALDEMLTEVRAGTINRILVYSLSRLSRNIIASHLLIEEFNSIGVELLSCTETLETDTPEGRLLYGLLALMNQFFREDGARKTKNGLKNAKLKGKKLGQKQIYDYGPILAMIDQGVRPGEVAKRLRVSRSAVYRAIKSRTK